MGRHLENCLDVSAHVKRVQHLIALVKHKMLQITRIEMFAANQGENSARCTNNNRRGFGFQLLDVSRNRLSSVHDLNRKFLFVEVLGEAIVLFLNLKG